MRKILLLFLMLFVVGCADDGGGSKTCKPEIIDMDCKELTQGELDALVLGLPVEVINTADSWEVDMTAHAGELDIKIELEMDVYKKVTGRVCNIL